MSAELIPKSLALWQHYFVSRVDALYVYRHVLSLALALQVIPIKKPPSAECEPTDFYTPVCGTSNAKVVHELKKRPSVMDPST